MNLKNILAVSGLPGLFNLVSSRPNGLVVSEFDNEKTRFCSVRKHQFTPLETVAIYTHEDTTPLAEIFATMKAQAESNPVISDKAPSDEMMDYFLSILPNYDEDKVYPSDVKKVIKWFNFLNSRNMLEDTETEVEELQEAAAIESVKEEVKTAKPKAEKTEKTKAKAAPKAKTEKASKAPKK